MSRELGAKRALELIADLKETAAEFARREGELDREVQGLSNKSSRLHREAIEVEDTALEGQVRRIDARYSELKSAVKTKYEGRREWLQHAYAAAKRDVPKRADRRKGGKLSKLQMEKHRADRSVGSDLEGADAAYATYLGELGGAGAELEALEKKTRGAFRGYFSFLGQVKKPRPGEVEAEDAGGDERERVDAVRDLVKRGEDELAAFKKNGLAMLFSFLPPWLLLILLGGGGWAWATFGGASPALAYGATGGAFVLLLVLNFVGGSGAKADAEKLAATVREARRTHDGCALSAERRRVSERERIEREYAELCARVEKDWGEAQEDEVDYQKERMEKVEAQMPRLSERLESWYQEKMGALDAAHPAEIAEVTAVADAKKAEVDAKFEGESGGLGAERDKRWAVLVEEWETRTKAIYDGLEAVRAEEGLFPEWDEGYVSGWSPAPDFRNVTKFGAIDVDVAAMAGALPEDARLALPGPAAFEVPLLLSYPHCGSILMETEGLNREEMVGALNNVILRLLATVPPGKVSFTVFDPVGLGESFSGLMHLADYEEGLINKRIWTQRDQMEERLAELNEHLEKIIQMYLRNEYETITQYNEAAGNIAEKYHFLVIADFPASFTDVAAKRLMSIATAGARCGVYMLILWDKRQPDADGVVPEDLRKASVCIRADRQGLVIDKEIREGTKITLDAAPNGDLGTDFIHKAGKASKDSNRVEVPFSYISPERAAFWDDETTDELRIAIGRTGATKLQYMEIGRGTKQHALFAGKTGSGKSTLFHVMVTNLAISCSPEQVEFYLIDFKKGVEFKCYAARRLPHAKVVAIESDREFGLSVLQRVDDELRRRGDLFRKAAVQDVAGYKATPGAEPMPRTLLMIDEFQEFFTEDDQIAQNASVLLDRIVRQGRAFGIHVLLGSQTLGGSYTLARTTLGQMVIRVALQCNEADAYLIMDDSNPAPRLLSRPGEGIYNDSAGALEGNSPFQVVWLPEEERDGYLATVREMSDEQFPDRYAGPIVFEGNAPADVGENPLLERLLSGGAPEKAPSSGRAWMGAPNSIKGPTEAVFHRQSGNHLMMVGQRDEAALAILGISLVSLAAQYPTGGAKFVVLDGTNPGSPEQAFLEAVVDALPQETRLAKSADVGEIMSELAGEMKERTENDTGAEAPAIFFVAHNLQKHKKLRAEDDFDFSFDEDAGGNPGSQFNDIIAEGSAVGIHVVAVVDSYNNVMRCLSRKALSEFEMRVLFQMSANDSSSLIDSPKASGLGMHRALFYNEHEGHLETFRPYALPTLGWVEEVKERLGKVHGAGV